MATRFRKTKKVGAARFTLGKKSFGTSVGGKFAGVSMNSRTGLRFRASLPGTGISYSVGGHGSTKGGHSILWWLFIGWWWWAVKYSVLLVFYVPYKLGKLVLNALGVKDRTNAAENVGVANTITPETGINLSNGVAKTVEEPKPQPATKKMTEVHKVAGVTYHKDEIMELAVENPDYDLTKREIIDAGMEDERIYQYDFPANKVELIDDPENEHDPNAIKVVIDGHHVGFIKKGSTGRIRNLRKAGRINKIDAEIAGGKYKVVSSYEEDDGREKYELERDSHEIGIKLTLHLNPEE